MASIEPPLQARLLLLGGQVQGVGFRPFVYRLAQRLGLRGWVENRMGNVAVYAQGRPAALDTFAKQLLAQAPAIARPQLIESMEQPPADLDGFRIRPSRSEARADIHLPPDYYTCDDCVRELNDPTDRRYRYPFINCTQCGPRYTLIARLPYDREHTSMAGFPLCPECRAEYLNPLDRRFHAEPLACPRCGPQLQLTTPGARPIDHTEQALAACIEHLRQGDIVAIKGVGGYHLMCAASDDQAVLRLRARKPRPHKPLAMMFPETGADGLDAVRTAVSLTALETSLLRSPMRPILLARTRRLVSAHIAPGLRETGVMLPYTPLHHLLLNEFGAPLIATSANISGEPVLTDAREVESRLGHVADAFLHHDRPILRPADDPVFRTIRGRPRPLRLGRGCAPLELRLPFTLDRPVLALGAQMKNTIALGWGDRVVISPHIGDMGTPRSLSVLKQVAEDLQTLYRVRAQSLVCDAHPGYATGRLARDSGLPVSTVYHHHAHASALVGETIRPREHNGAPWLVFTWDGVGYGEDGSLWGGEALLGRPGHWERVATMRPLRLPGGEKAGREPWRSAAAACWQAGREWSACPQRNPLLRQAWEKGLNTPPSSAVGRLFDAAAALTGVLQRASFEGQGPMLLEAACQGQNQVTGEPLSLPLRSNASGILETDWEPLLEPLLDPSRSVAERGALFHRSLAQSILETALAIQEKSGCRTVGLTGGVFQNRLLTETAAGLLEGHDFSVRLGQRVPGNDAGISFGQIVEAGSRGFGVTGNLRLGEPAGT